MDGGEDLGEIAGESVDGVGAARGGGGAPVAAVVVADDPDVSVRPALEVAD
jgi:hypothetical protein